MEKMIIGVDVGGTNVRVAAVDLKGEILHKVSAPIGASGDREWVTRNILSKVQEVLGKFPQDEFEVMGGGFGIPGAIALNQGIVIQSPNLPALDGFNIRSWLEERLSMPIFLENDANTFTLGEGWLGAAKGVKDFCCLTLGTGVGGGILLNGEIWHGAEGKAGEFGHMIIDAEGPLCKCGNHGCLEAFTSANAIRRMAIEALRAEEKTDLLNRCGGELEAITSKMVYESAKDGDIVSRKIFQRMGTSLGVGLANLANLLNMELMVIGGQVSDAWDFFIDHARRELAQRALGSMGKRVKVERTRRGDDAGILGAVYLVMRELGTVLPPPA
jgi:glucokinase